MHVIVLLMLAVLPTGDLVELHGYFADATTCNAAIPSAYAQAITAGVRMLDAKCIDMNPAIPA